MRRKCCHVIKGMFRKKSSYYRVEHRKKLLYGIIRFLHTETGCFIFTKQAVGADYDNAYWIIGSFRTVFDVVENSEGDKYLIDRSGFIGKSITDDVRNMAYYSNLVKELKKQLIEQDSIWEEIEHPFSYVFSLEQIENLISSLNNNE